MSENIVQDKVRSIREFVTQRRIQDKLWQNKGAYLQLCACMDTVSDTQQGIDSYKKNIAAETKDTGQLYLELYGLLQLVFVQQDAVEDMAKSLGLAIKIDDYPALKQIRAVRNKATGHPTNHRDRFYNSIVQHSLGRRHFEVFTYDTNGAFSKELIDVATVIKDQEQYISFMMDSMHMQLKHIDEQHKQKFKNEKLAACFTEPDIFYYCSKVMETITSPSNPKALGLAGIQGIEKALRNFEQKLGERGLQISTYPGIEMSFQDCEYPVKQLRLHLEQSEGTPTSTIGQQTARIFAEYLQGKIEELFEMAKEVDEEYTPTTPQQTSCSPNTPTHQT